MSRKGNRGQYRKHLPVGVVAGMEVELPVQVALSALGTSWLTIGHIDEIFIQGLISFKLGLGLQKQRGLDLCNVCIGIKDRFNRLRKVGTTAEELTTIRTLAPQIIDWVNQQPAARVRQCLGE